MFRFETEVNQLRFLQKLNRKSIKNVFEPHFERRSDKGDI